MDDDDYTALVALMQEELRLSGAFELAEAAYYTIESEDGEARPMEPREHLLTMIDAFGRLLAIQDRATYALAMGRLREWTEGEKPEAAAYIGLEGTADLGEAPQLSALREDLGRFVENLFRDEPRPR